MIATAIRVEGLGKRYRIGAPEKEAKSLYSVRNVMTAPFGCLLTALRKPSAEEILWALRDVSFEVERGEIVGIIGKNGAGKSTLLKILSRITGPTTGIVEIRGRVGSLLEVGTGFHPELTGRENIYLNGAILGMKKAEIDRKFGEIVEFAGIGQFLDTPVKRYSSGMYVRLAFAIAAHLEPEILLVDEVLAVGDIEFQKKCFGQIGKISGEGRTVLVVSHSMSTVRSLCSKALLLERGSIRAIGPVDDIINYYLGATYTDGMEKTINDEDHDAGGGNAIRVRHVGLLHGLPNSFTVHWKQPISVAVEIEVFEYTENISFGAAIRLPDGSFVLVVYNDDNGRPTWNLEPGKYTVEFTIQNNLKPGIYKLHVGAYQQYSRLKNLFALDAVNIEILEFSEDGQVPSTANPGLVSGVQSVFSIKGRAEIE